MVDFAATNLTGAHPTDAGGTPAWLLPQRGVWLPAYRALVVADVHLGKAASFRALGVPVPGGTTDATLARLGALVDALAPAMLIVLGDLLHGPVAQRAAAVDALARWRARRAGVDVVLVRGNHDGRAGDPPPRCGVRALDAPFALGSLRLCHEPDDGPARRADPQRAHVFCGHVHPVYRLRGRADALRLPAFWLRRACTVLPAFGDFTGGWAVTPLRGESVLISDGERLHRVPSGGRDDAGAGAAA
jgi:DNA ligase-associated metallophosphoesterase